jgi:hypothetical protein
MILRGFKVEFFIVLLIPAIFSRNAVWILTPSREDNTKN